MGFTFYILRRRRGRRRRTPGGKRVWRLGARRRLEMDSQMEVFPRLFPCAWNPSGHGAPAAADAPRPQRHTGAAWLTVVQNYARLPAVSPRWLVRGVLQRRDACVWCKCVSKKGTNHPPGLVHCRWRPVWGRRLRETSCPRKATGHWQQGKGGLPVDV